MDVFQAALDELVLIIEVIFLYPVRILCANFSNFLGSPTIVHALGTLVLYDIGRFL